MENYKRLQQSLTLAVKAKTDETPTSRKIFLKRAIFLKSQSHDQNSNDVSTFEHLQGERG